ncbi:MAG: glycosyltransferase family 2 protein [Eubacteriales bacterium]
MKKISIVVPCYCEEASLPLFYESIEKVSLKLSECCFEFIFIDDGSKDNTLQIIKDLKIKDQRVEYISFSRNFGKEAAIYAGLQNSKGDYVVVIDADLQHSPDLIPEMYNLVVNEGYDCVATRRTNRAGEPFFRSFFAKQFYKFINKVSKVEFVDGAMDFRFMTRQVVQAILNVKEYNRFSKGIFEWVGFRRTYIECPNIPRIAGNSNWSFWGLLLYSLDGIIAFSTVPLAIASFTGLLFCFLAITLICYVVVKTLLYGDPVAGYPTLICIILLIGGLQLFCIGILGQYLSKTYLETKERPIYISKESSIAI